MLPFHQYYPQPLFLVIRCHPGWGVFHLSDLADLDPVSLSAWHPWNGHPGEISSRQWVIEDCRPLSTHSRQVNRRSSASTARNLFRSWPWRSNRSTVRSGKLIRCNVAFDYDISFIYCNDSLNQFSKLDFCLIFEKDYTILHCYQRYGARTNAKSIINSGLINIYVWCRYRVELISRGSALLELIFVRDHSFNLSGWNIHEINYRL